MIKVYTDGCTNEKIQKSGIGILIQSEEGNYTYSYSIPYCSNHEAEFISVWKALEICTKLFPNEMLSFRSDSQVVVQAIEKEYIKNSTFQTHFKKIMQYKQQFPLFFIKWVPSKDNNCADKLAKNACYEKNKESFL